MTSGSLSRRCEFTPVPSHRSIFVYMTPPQNFMPARVTPAWVQPGCCTGARISLRYGISQQYHVTRFGVKSVYRWTGTGSACVMFADLNRLCILSIWSVPSNKRDMKWPIIMWLYKCDTKLKSHPWIKLTPVWVFSCKHPLGVLTQSYYWKISSNHIRGAFHLSELTRQTIPVVLRISLLIKTIQPDQSNSKY